MDAATGVIRGQTTLTGAVTSPTVDKGLVYAGSDAGDLYAVDAVTGAIRWFTHVGGAVSSPTVAKGVVYVGSVDGNLYAADAARWPC